MTKTTCDRCGKIMDMNFMDYIFSNHEEGQWVPTVLVNAKDPETGIARKIDICQDCEKALYTFIFGEKAKVCQDCEKALYTFIFGEKVKV